MGLFKGAEAPSGVMKTFSPAATISQRIASYGTAVTVGVFIGAALTTGVACGVAGWWATSKVHVLSFLRTMADEEKPSDSRKRMTYLGKMILNALMKRSPRLKGFCFFLWKYKGGGTMR